MAVFFYELRVLYTSKNDWNSQVLYKIDTLLRAIYKKESKKFIYSLQRSYIISHSDYA